MIYTCFGQTRKRDVPETAVTHLCRCLEDMIVLMRRMDEDAAAEKAKTEQPKPEGEAKPEPKKKLSETVKGGKWVWIVDFEDFGAPLTRTLFIGRARDLCIPVYFNAQVRSAVCARVCMHALCSMSPRMCLRHSVASSPVSVWLTLRQVCRTAAPLRRSLWATC